MVTDLLWPVCTAALILAPGPRDAGLHQFPPARERDLPPADQWAVLPHTTLYNDAGRMLTDHLLRLVRNAERDIVEQGRKVRSAKDLRALQDRVRRQLLDGILGGLPEQGPLNARVTGAFERDAYRVENIVYESAPGFEVAANLYIPKRRAFPAPGIVCPCGHSGKEQAQYQELGISFASNGYVTLVIDQPDRGDRTTPGNDHFGVGALTYLTGANAERYFTADALRGLDYLCTRPEVDASRIACTGVSGGAVTTLHAAALDGRIRCAVPVCGVIPLRQLCEILYTTCPEQLQQNTLGRGVDEMEVAALIAPRPLLLLQGNRDDLFSVPEFVSGCQRIRHYYAAADADDRIDWQVSDAPHSYDVEMREAALRWFGKWIGDAETTATDPEIVLAEEDALHTGAQMGATIHSLNADIARGLAASRPRLGTEDLRAAARELLAVEPAGDAPVVIDTGTMFGRDMLIDKLVLEPEPGIHLPTWVLRPSVEANDALIVIYASESGKASAAQSGRFAALVRAGFRVVAVDVRGTGETAMAPTRWDIHGYCRVERVSAYMSFVVSRPALGMRVADILATVRWVREQGRPIAVWGEGQGALWALYAALLSDDISAVVAEDGPLSYQEIAETMDYTWPETTLLPGVLRSHDIGDVLGALAPRPVLVLGPADAHRAPVPSAAAEEALGPARQGYTRTPRGLQVLCEVTDEEATAAGVEWLRRAGPAR